MIARVVVNLCRALEAFSSGLLKEGQVTYAQTIVATFELHDRNILRCVQAFMLASRCVLEYVL
jgi:hypothetical protein